MSKYEISENVINEYNLASDKLNLCVKNPFLDDDQKRAAYNEAIKTELINILLTIEDNSELDKSHSLNRRIHDLINIVYELQEITEKQQQMQYTFDEVEEYLNGYTYGLNAIYYLGKLHGLTVGLNRPEYWNRWNDAAEYTIKQLKNNYYSLNNLEEVYELHKFIDNLED